MRRIVSLAAWWAALVLLWIAFVGTTTRQEVLAGLGAAVVAVAALEVLRAQGLLHFRVDRRWLARAWSSPAQIVYDFALLTSLLFRRGRVEGEYLTVDFPAGDSHAQYAWRRAWVTTIGTISPNVLVVEIDPEQKTALLHSLDVGAWKGQQPL